MFDEVRAINISHNNFDRKHNGYIFQTKSLECDMSEYCVFNGELYQEANNSGGHDQALKYDFSGILNIYTDIQENGIQQWIEYELIFENGSLTDVIHYTTKVMKDNRDLSAFRPEKPANRVEVTLCVSHCDDEKKAAFIESLSDEKLQAIRDILDEPTATIFYPAKMMADTGFGFPAYPDIRTIASVIQSKEDAETVTDGTINDTVEITVEPTGRIVIEPARAQVYSLEALLAGVTKSNIHERQDFGPATGQELI